MNTNTIGAAVAEKLSAQGVNRVVDMVVDLMVEQEITRRVTAMNAVIALIDGWQKELRRLKPDLVSFNEAGEQSSSGFSKGAIDSRKKLSESIERAEKAIEQATNQEKPDFSKLFELANKKPNESGKDPADGPGKGE